MAIHATAIIDKKAEIDSTTDIGPFCVIEGHVRVAGGCRLYQGVYLTGWTEIGEDCVIHPHTVVGHEPQDVKYKGERSYCRVGRGTILRENVTIHRGTIPESATVVGEDCFLLAGAHVGHNCVVGNNVTIINNVLLAGHVEVGDRVTLGGAAGIHQFVRIGELAMISGTARVVQDILPFALIDPDGRIAGLNRIGLRRAGISRDEVHHLRLAYRTLFASDLPFSEATKKVATEPATGATKRLAQFLQQPSKRGIAGRSRSRRKASTANET